MSTHVNPKFPHRHNKDGSCESICTACLLTLAKRQDEDELLAFELTHVCDPIRLFQLGKLESFDRAGANAAF
jgi:hypothetical protein